MRLNQRSTLRKKPLLRHIAVAVVTMVAATATSQTVQAQTPGNVAAPALKTVQPASRVGRPTTEQAALRRAAATGEPVTVDDATTETSDVAAQPDGTFELTSSLRPVRVRDGDTWTSVDTSLQTASDGTLHPIASTMDMTFSGGGTTPLVTVADDDGHTISYTWPDPLPAPIVNGPVAIYRSVLPGVDLQMTADSDSYSEVLVVADAQAAANPGIQHLTMSAHSEGLTLQTSTSGRTGAADPDGKTVFTGAPPQMWDSTNQPKVGSAPTASDPGSGKVTLLSTTMADTTTTPAPDPDDSTTDATVEISPPATALQGPTVKYPLYIDPALTQSKHNYADVQSNGITGFNDPTGFPDLKVGRCDFAGCNNLGTSRAYFDFDTTALTGRATTAKVYSAQVSVIEIHEAVACLTAPVDLMATNNRITATTRWPGPSTTVLDEKSSNSGTNCPSSPASSIAFSGANLTNYLQAAANIDDTSRTFALQSPDETTSNQWKRFDLNPKLIVSYNFPPSVATATGLSGTTIDCSGQTVVTTARPTMTGKGHDNNISPLRLALNFDIYTHGTGTLRYSSPDVDVASDTVGAYAPAGSLADGSYDYVVRSHNITADGSPVQAAASASTRVAFVVDTAAPTGTPTATSWDFPKNSVGQPYWGALSGTGTITLNDGAATNAVGFAYGWDSASNIASIPSTQCTYNQRNGTTGGLVPDVGGVAQITPAALPAGPHTLYFRSFDAAHLMSAATGSYSIYVAPAIAGEANTQPEAETFTGSAVQTTIRPIPNSSPPANCGDGSTTYDESLPWTSGGKVKHLLATCGNPTYGTTFSFTYNAPVSADYAFGVSLIMANHFGIYQFSLTYPDGSTHSFNDNNTGLPFKFNAYSASPVDFYQELGGMHLQAGNYKFNLQAVGTTGVPYSDGGVNDHGYSLGFDFLTMVPINNVTTASFTAAMNNNGISSDGAGGASIGPSGARSSLSAQAMQAAGFGPNQTKSVDGVSFTMPAPNSGGYDNVIAIGQTIPVPWTPTPVNNIDLLVTDSCGGPSPMDPTITVTMNYTGNNYSANQIPSIPEWSTTPVPTAFAKAPAGFVDVNTNQAVYDTLTRAVTMPYINANTTKDTTHTPSLYHLRLPVAFPSSTITTITLPNLGSDLTMNCTQAIHVFAISHS